MRIVEHEGEPSALLDLWRDGEDGVLVDAVRSGAGPGTVHRLDAVAGPLPADLFATSTHHLSVADAVELARALGRLPRGLVVYGIEGRDFGAGQGITPDVEQAIERVVAELAA
jgi:hydrogenase maturation protease